LAGKPQGLDRQDWEDAGHEVQDQAAEEREAKGQGQPKGRPARRLVRGLGDALGQDLEGAGHPRGIGEAEEPGRIGACVRGAGR
jgi:hypothetical protein